MSDVCAAYRRCGPGRRQPVAAAHMRNPRWSDGTPDRRSPGPKDSIEGSGKGLIGSLRGPRLPQPGRWTGATPGTTRARSPPAGEIPWPASRQTSPLRTANRAAAGRRPGRYLWHRRQWPIRSAWAPARAYREVMFMPRSLQRHPSTLCTRLVAVNGCLPAGVVRVSRGPP